MLKPKKLSNITGKPLKDWRDYNYNFSFQRKVSKGLLKGDIKRIAVKTGYSYGYIHDVTTGKRKNDEIFSLIRKIVKINKQFKKL